MNRSLQRPCRLAPRPSPSGRKEVCGLQPQRVRAGCPGCGEGPGRGTRTWPFLLNRGPLSWQPGCPRSLRGGPGCSRSCVAARGSLFPNPFLPLPSQLSDLVCGLPASGAHSHSLFSVSSAGLAPNLFLALPSVLASASCRPQTGTVGHRGDSVKNRTAFYSRSIRLDPRTYEFKHE